ncbi:MAG: PKD domain-containing protein [Phaeodactylibacter sp.]|uniref:PKD domain-containing protein n=1 Tax=Phaeodactylibacter sp. TaxID=1940289 RepID=UPI0032EF88C4
MKTLTCLVLSLFLLSGLLAQTDTLSGVINHYSPVSAIDTCTARVTVGNATNFQQGDTILIVQMQGAAISVADNSQFGSLTGLGAAGTWEQAVIQEVQDNDLLLAQSLLNTYNIAGNVQVVSIPYFQQAIITGSVTAQAWDGQTGGILAFRAGTLTLNGGLTATGKGFRGGSAALDYDGSCTWLINYEGYRFAAGSIRGGLKGEGIGGIPTAWPRGRGAAANGGGGGNDHNAGGGGGALLTAGGRGGENDNPDFFGCKGFGEGAAGWALPNNDRLFMGGGGGAGHGNNNVATDGGNGGGIILLEADQIISNNGFIVADGMHALNTGGDGAGGGGAGGMILVNANNILGAITPFSAMGGNGGSANNNNQDQCFGPGGGGSGGYIRIPDGFDTDILLQGGEPGLSLNSSACPESPNGGTAGSNGLIEGPPVIPYSTAPTAQPPVASTDQDTLTACADQLTLSALPGGPFSSLSWEFDDGSGFVPVPDNAVYDGTDTPNLLINNPAAAAGFSFRLSVSSNCFPPVYSPLIEVTPGAPPVADFFFEVNGLTVSFGQTSTNGISYNWDFGDGNTATAPSPDHTYATAGHYTVTLTAANACGDDTIEKTIIVGSAPVADFSVSGSSSGCAPRSIGFVNQSTGTFDSLLWDFPGGTPASSTQPNPTITYETPGTYDVSLTLFSSFGPQQTTVEDQVLIYTRPTAAFVYEADGFTVTFTNLSADATFYSWNFGDGSTSMDAAPVHTFPGPGSYEVTLNASNPNCSRAITESIFLQPSGTRVTEPRQRVQLFPNPAADQTCLLALPSLPYPIAWQCFNATGQLAASGQLSPPENCIDLRGLPGSTYYIKVWSREGMFVLPVVVL